MPIPIEETQNYSDFCEERLQDPYPLFARLREEDPVHWNANIKLWLLTRYDDVAEMLRDKRLSASRDNIYQQAMAPELQERVKTLLGHFRNWLLILDPPEHTLLCN